MEDFIDTLSGSSHDRLASAIQGKGAFCRFKDAVIRLGIDKQWYDFQADAYKRKAARWCEDNGIEYEEWFVVMRDRYLDEVTENGR